MRGMSECQFVNLDKRKTEVHLKTDNPCPIVHVMHVCNTEYAWLAFSVLGSKRCDLKTGTVRVHPMIYCTYHVSNVQKKAKKWLGEQIWISKSSFWLY